jgi:hypothetical protein
MTKKQATMKKQIELWRDRTSDGDNPRWCVSLCWGDGDEIRCLSVHKQYSAALTAAVSEARRRELSLCERDERGKLNAHT